MKSCILMHNMIVEDEQHYMTSNFYTTLIAQASFSRNELLWIWARTIQFEDVDIFYNLRDDLLGWVKGCWGNFNVVG